MARGGGPYDIIGHFLIRFPLARVAIHSVILAAPGLISRFACLTGRNPHDLVGPLSTIYNLPWENIELNVKHPKKVTVEKMGGRPMSGAKTYKCAVHSNGCKHRLVPKTRHATFAMTLG